MDGIVEVAMAVVVGVHGVHASRRLPAAKQEIADGVAVRERHLVIFVEIPSQELRGVAGARDRAAAEHPSRDQNARRC
ncbi:MAG TPA: hypothetical protein VFD71_09460 [Planctomycetota bacterium]|nr:hypothetical protein [Planctomycetota bacterium]